jgi:hypothetical protein
MFFFFPLSLLQPTTFDDDLYDFPDYYPFSSRKLTFALEMGKWDGCSRFWLLLCNSHDFTRELKAIVLILLQEQYSIVSNPIFLNP